MRVLKGENWGNVTFSKQKNLGLIPRIPQMNHCEGRSLRFTGQCVLLVSPRPMRDPLSEEVDGISKDDTQGCPQVSTWIIMHIYV